MTWVASILTGCSCSVLVFLLPLTMAMAFACLEPSPGETADSSAYLSRKRMASVYFFVTLVLSFFALVWLFGLGAHLLLSLGA